MISWKLSSVCLLAMSACKPKNSSTSDELFYGPDQRMANMKFLGVVQLDVESAQLSSLPETATVFDISSDALKKVHDLAKKEINAQLQYIVGALKHQTPPNHPKYADFPANVLTKNYHIQNTSTKIITKDDIKTTLEVSYSFENNGVFHLKFFEDNKTTSSIRLALPIAPSKLLKKFTTPTSVAACTGEEEGLAANLWYYFNPYNPKCAAIQREKDLLEVYAKLTSVASTQQTYPPVASLLKDDGQLTISIIQGGIKHLEDLPKKIPEAFNQIDLFKKALYSDGSYVRFIDNAKKIQQITKGTLTWEENPFHSDVPLRATIKGQYLAKPLKIDLQFHYPRGKNTKFLFRPANSQSFNFDNYFMNELAQTMNESDIVFYSGHSGLGANIAPWRLLEAHKNGLIKNKLTLAAKPQIFFFDGCSSTGYFSAPYLNLKRQIMGQANNQWIDPRGTKNLDILANIRESWSFNEVVILPEFITSILQIPSPSYQEILDRLYTRTNQLEAQQNASSAFLHVIGDEE